MLGVSDVVEVQYPGCVDTGNPLTRGLVGCAIPVWLAGSGPPEIPHRPAYLRRLFEEGQALYIDGRGFSACEVITKVSSEIGTAHHSDRVVPWLATAMEYEAGQLPVLAVSMAQYGVLAVAYAEVLLGAAVGQIGYVRRRPVFPGAVDLAQLIPNGPRRFPITPSEASGTRRVREVCLRSSILRQSFVRTGVLLSLFGAAMSQSHCGQRQME